VQHRRVAEYSYAEAPIIKLQVPNKFQNPMTEEKRQQEKEEAVLLALQQDMALIRRDLEVWGMKKDGSVVPISKSTDHDRLWSDALSALK
jgi:hypothetical protein